MEASSSSSSSGTAHNLQEHLAESHVSTPSHKFSPSQSLTIEEVSGPELERRISKQTWYRRFGRAAGFENAKVQKVWQYIRGPRPKRDLAGEHAHICIPRTIPISDHPRHNLRADTFLEPYVSGRK